MVRQSSRGILIKGSSIGVMQREREGRKFCAFPGGGIEKDEDPKACVVRELEEEFGIKVEPIRLVYTYYRNDRVEYFYLLKWLEGEIHITADGEEYQPVHLGGYYNPTLMEIEKIKENNLMPPEICDQFIKDFNKYGAKLSSKSKKIKSQE